MAPAAAPPDDHLFALLPRLAEFQQVGDLLLFLLQEVSGALGASGGLGASVRQGQLDRSAAVQLGLDAGSETNVPDQLAQQAARLHRVVEADGWTALPLVPGECAKTVGVLVLRVECPLTPLSAPLSTLLTVAALALDRLHSYAARQELAEQAARERELLLVSPVPIAAGSLDGSLELVNDAYLDMLGRTREEFEAGQVDWAAMTPAEYRRPDEEAFERALTKGQSGWYQKEMLNHAGERIPMEVALFRHDTQAPLVVGYLRDLREQRALEAARANVTAELQELLQQQGLTLAQLAAQLQQKNDELEARTRVLEGMAQLTQNADPNTDPYRLIYQAQQLVRELLPQGFALYHEPEGGIWHLRSQVGDVGNPDLQRVLDAGLNFETSQNLLMPWQTGQPYFQDRYDQQSDGLAEVTGQLQSTATIPLHIHGRPRGVFSFGVNIARPWTATEKMILESVTAQLELALERQEETRLLVDRSRELESSNALLAARTQALEGFNELSRNLVTESDPLLLIGRAQELVVSLMPEGISTYYELEGGRWQLRSHRGTFPDPGLLESLRGGLPLGRTIILDQPYQTRQPLYQDVYDPATNTTVTRSQTSLIRTSASFPVYIGSEVRGVLVVARFRTVPWTPADRTLLETVLFSLQLALERAERTSALQRHAEELERSNAELERFAFIASHDLQEPLRTVAITSERLLGSLQEPTEAQVRFSGYIRENTRRMQSLLQDLRAFMELAHQQQEPRTVDLGRKVAHALDTLQDEVQRSGAEIDVQPLPAVQADPEQMQVLFTHLLDNALKFTAEGQPPKVRISGHQTGDWVEIAVQDQGIGIAPEHFGQIFTVFQRLHGREKYPGNGIGLSMVQRIVQLHGGRSWVRSVPEQGSTFFFTLPAAKGIPNKVVEFTSY